MSAQPLPAAGIIDRLLDEADKARRKGHLVLAQVCLDAADRIGLLEHEVAQRRGARDADRVDSA